MYFKYYIQTNTYYCGNDNTAGEESEILYYIL